MSIRDLFKKFKSDVHSNILNSRSNSLTDLLNKEADKSVPQIIDQDTSSKTKINNPSKRKIDSKESFSSEDNENTIPFHSLPTEWRPQLKKPKKSTPKEPKEPKEKIKPVKLEKIKPEKTNPGPLGMKILSKESIEEIVKCENFEETENKSTKPFKIPNFLKPENILDKNLLSPEDTGYDPSTIHITYDEWTGMTSFMRQYWEVKRVHFDKIVAHSMFDMYWFYYEDAMITAKILDLKLGTHEDKIQSYIHTKAFDKNVSKLLDAGYKVVIVEKIDGVYDDPIKSSSSKKNKEAVLNREISQIISKGTYLNFDDSYEPRFALALFERESKFGVLLMETTLHEFYADEFKDNEIKSKIKTLMRKYRPREIVFFNEFISPEILNFAKSLPSKPMLTSYSFEKNITSSMIIAKMQILIGETPKIFEKVHIKSFEGEISSADEGYQIINSLGLCFKFLEDLLLAKIILPKVKWFTYSDILDSKACMYMDSQALESLEINEVPYHMSNEKLSLFGVLDKTVSPFGRRMLKRWINAPLIDPIEIRSRNMAVEDLLQNPKAVEIFQSGLGKMGDLERKVHKICNQIDKKKMRALKADDVISKRMQEFDELLNELKTVEINIKFFQEYHPKFKSQRLKHLSLLRSNESANENYSISILADELGLFPRLNPTIDEIQSKYHKEENKYYPSIGSNRESDFLLSQLDSVKTELNTILEETRHELRSKDINFSHAKKPYEIEIPDHLTQNINRDKYILGSSRKGFIRYYTLNIETLVNKKTQIEERLDKFMQNYILDIFTTFYKHSALWDQAILCLAEIDCLASLSKYARELDIKCKPEVLPMSNEPIFELENIKHPLLQKSNGNIVSNDIFAESPIFFITGPNMGGKSTLLRTACLATILAQIGSYVPATKFRLTAVDRIFTRIGASDRLMEGKSTFYIELEEVYHMVTEATRNSLLVIDELGRGTGTFDGVALAYSILRFISEKIKCLTFFATHYHTLLGRFREFSNLKSYYMDYDYTETDELIFKFKLKAGQDCNSHGLKIAQMANIDDEVIQIAKEKSNNFGNITKKYNLDDKLGQIMHITEFVKAENLSKESENLFEILTGLIMNL